MECVKCSRETKNGNELCNKCLKKEEKEFKKNKLRENKKLLANGKFKKITNEEIKKTRIRVATTKGINACIISFISAITSVCTSILIVPGFIFGIIGLVEAVLSFIYSIINRPKSYKNLLSLFLSFFAFLFSLIACTLTTINLGCLIFYLFTGNDLGIVSILFNLIK